MDVHELRHLMVAYQEGDTTAFDSLHAELRPMLFRFALKLARDAAWADDIVQETFLQLHRARRTYSADFPVQPWVFAIARHVFLMSRRTRLRRHDFDDCDPAALDRLSIRDHEAACVAKSRLAHGLAALPADARRALVLRHGLGLSFREISGRLGLAAPVVRMRVSRAAARVRRGCGATGAPDVSAGWVAR